MKPTFQLFPAARPNRQSRSKPVPHQVRASWGFHKSISVLLLVLLSLPHAGISVETPFDYFQNSWSVIGLKDYNDGTRITPNNELLLANKTRLRFSCGTPLTPLSRQQTKTLLEGWLPVVLLNVVTNDVRYEFVFWATPLPDVQNWAAAFDWPTEGENFLNWIKIRATNLGTKPVQASVHVDALTTNTPISSRDWTAQLAPAHSAETCFRFPFSPVSNPSAFDAENPARWLKRTVRYWRGVMAHAARFEVPCAKSTQTLRAAHVCQLIASDHGVLHGGEGFYDEFYIRDGGYQLLELEEAGLFGPARKALESYLRSQRPDGRFESQKNQLDANGQALWVLWQFWKITNDTSWLRQVYPQMFRAADWIRQARAQAPTNSPFAGLLPNAVADGEFLWDGKHHIVGYDFWNLRGLLCAADAAQALGLQTDAQAWQREAEDYRKAIDRAWRSTGLSFFPPSWENAGTHWGNTEVLWPTELFPPDDPRVTALMTEVRQHHGGGFAEGTIRWTGQPDAIHPYLSAYTTMSSLIRGEHDQFVEDYFWYLLHSSATHAFPEGIYFKRRFAWSDTIPHVTGAANFAFLLRHALIHETRDELHLLPGVPDTWLENEKEISIENAPTHFGPISLRVRGRTSGLQLKFSPPRRNPPARIVLHLPASRPALNTPAKCQVIFRKDPDCKWDYSRVVLVYERSKEDFTSRDAKK